MSDERLRLMDKLRNHNPYPSWQQVFDDAADTIDRLEVAVGLWEIAAANWRLRAEHAERELASAKKVKREWGSLSARVADLERTRSW